MRHDPSSVYQKLQLAGRDTELAHGDPDWPALLGRSMVFGVLSEAGRIRLARAGTSVSLERGAVLCAAGDPGDAAYLILSGEIEISVPVEDGADLLLSHEGAGAVIGELALLDGEPRSADMVATRRSRLLRLSRAALVGALRDEPEFAMTLLAMLSRRLRAANSRVEESTVLDLGGRLARLLVQEPGAAFTRTQGDIARLIGASRERVNRKLGEWRSLGWITMDARGVHVRDHPALARLARLGEAAFTQARLERAVDASQTDAREVRPEAPRPQIS